MTDVTQCPRFVKMCGERPRRRPATALASAPVSRSGLHQAGWTSTTSPTSYLER